jgi:predicted ester cyclase
VFVTFGAISPLRSRRSTTVTVEDNKAIVRAYMSDANDQTRPFEYNRHFSQNAMFNGVRSLDLLLARQKMMRTAFTGYRRIIEDQIGEGDKVVTRVTFEGVHTGEFNGVAPTGTSVKFRGVAIDRLEDGKVVEMWHMADTMALMQQIGAVFPPTQTT